MPVTDMPGEVREHLASLVEIAHEIVTGAVDAGVEQAQRVIPDYASRVTKLLPSAVGGVDRGFERVERWLRPPHDTVPNAGDASRASA